MVTKSFHVDGMTCEHCRRAVTKALAGLDGVQHARVDLSSSRAEVTFDEGRVTEEQLAQAVEEAGYRLVAPSV